jgi:hypothetical protein
VANAENGKMNVYDGATYTLKKTIDFGVDSDNVRYDSASKKIFVGFGYQEPEPEPPASPCCSRNRLLH